MLEVNFFAEFILLYTVIQVWQIRQKHLKETWNGSFLTFVGICINVTSE